MKQWSVIHGVWRYQRRIYVLSATNSSTRRDKGKAYRVDQDMLDVIMKELDYEGADGRIWLS